MISRVNFIVQQFLGNVDIVFTKKLKGGNINQTYLVRTKKEADKMFILQQVNNSVFKDVPALMSNLQLITEHLQNKISAIKPDFPFYTFSFYRTPKSKHNYYIHSDGSYWRLSDYVAHVVPSDSVIDPSMAWEAGKLFGFFITQLVDIKLDNIKEIIIGFHNSYNSYQYFLKAEKTDICNRLDVSKNIFETLNKYSWLIDEFEKVTDNKNIPYRLVHNDTKIDNILFNDNHEAVAVIDLDTCMSGYLMSDFGDAIRSITNNGLEDDKDLENVSFNIDLYKGFTKGFFSTIKSVIVDDEKDNLAFFALLITYKQAIRFYTDYLNGDTYYQTEYAEHNLQRAKAQLKLLEDMLKHYDEMKRIVKSL